MKIEEAPELVEVRGEIYLPIAALRRAERAARGGGRADLRQPAQLGGRLAAPARPADHRGAAALDVDLRDRRPGRLGAREPQRDARVAPRARLPGERRGPGARASTRWPSAATGGGPARRSSTSRSTGWWSRWTTAAFSASWASPAASRAGRSPGIPAVHRDDEAEQGRLERRPHRPPAALGGAGAGARLRRHGLEGDPPQRGGPGAQGRARRGRGGRAASRRRDPPGRLADHPAAQGKRPRKPKPPKKCPLCGTPTVKPEDSVFTICPNRTGCPGQRFQHVKHFRGALEIEGLGEKNACASSRRG